MNLMRKRSLILILFLLTILLAACQRSTPTAPVSTLETPPTVTATETPEANPERMIVSGGEVSPETRERLDTLAAGQGWQLDVQDSVQPAGLDEQVRVLIFLSKPANLDEILAAQPSRPVIVISGDELPTAGNLTQVKTRPETAVFMAGYLSALVAEDWRVGALLPGDDAAVEEVFENGARFLCGNCSPSHPPYVFFPSIASLASNAGGAEWREALKTIAMDRIDVLYLDAVALLPEVIDEALAQNMKLIGNQTPPENARSVWLATIRLDALATVETAWSEILAGQGGRVLNAQPALTDVDASILTPGKQQLFEATCRELIEGRIYPFDVK